MKNIDVLLWGRTILTTTLVRVLKKYPDITVFTKENLYPGIQPDLVILTADDPFLCLEDRITVQQEFPEAPIVCIQDTFDIVALGCLFTAGIEYLITADILPDQLHKIIQVAGFTAKQCITKKQRTRILNKQFRELNNTGLTFKELAVLGGSVRAISAKKLAMLLDMSPVDVNYTVSTICKKLGINRRDLTTPYMIRRYGSIKEPVPYKKYVIRAVRKKPSYYVIPRMY